MYEAGASISQCAKHFNTSHPTIWHVLNGNYIQCRGRGRPIGSGVINKMSKEEHASHIEERYPGINKLLGNHSITLASIGDQFGLSRERIRQYEKILGFPTRQSERHERAELNKKLTRLQREERKKKRKKKWVDLATKITLLIEMGSSIEEIRDAIPWKMGGKTPLGQQIAIAIIKLRKLSGINVPRRVFKNWTCARKRNIEHSARS